MKELNELKAAFRCCSSSWPGCLVRGRDPSPPSSRNGCNGSPACKGSSKLSERLRAFSAMSLRSSERESVCVRGRGMGVGVGVCERECVGGVGVWVLW